MSTTPSEAPPWRSAATSSPRSPGRVSVEKLARKKTYVADGVGTTLPVFIEAAGRRRAARRRRQLADRPRLRHRGDHGRQRRRRRSSAACRTRSPRSRTRCFMVTPYDGYVDVCEALAELTPGDHAKKSALFNSGAEAVENAVKIARVATGRDAVAVFDHAYHGRTNLTMAMTAKNMPYKNGFGPFAGEVYRVPMSYPFRETAGDQGRGRRGAGDRPAREAGRRRRTSRASSIEPILGEGGFVVPAEGFLPALAAWCRDERRAVRRRRDPDRLLPHRRVVRLRPRGRRARPDHDRQGHRRRAPARRGHRPGRGDGRRPRRRSRRHVRRQPGRLRGRPSARSRRCGRTTCAPGPAPSSR